MAGISRANYVCLLSMLPLMLLGAHRGLSHTLEANEGQLQQDIAALIEQLADDNYHRRINAKWALERIGLPAFEQLRQAASAHTDAHIAREASYIVESQKVRWWLETDSLQVRELLKNYNTSSAVDRDTLLGQLADHGSDDALLALCRLARFESSELRSKSAALHLMQEVVKRDRRTAGEPSVAGAPKAHGVDATFPKSMRLTLGNSNRAAAVWLSTLMDELETSHSGKNLSQWQNLIAEEHVLASALDEHKHAEIEARQSLAVALRFYRWLGTWITQNYSRELALEVVTPSLDLIGENTLAIRVAATWALESELPELLPSLAARYRDEFDREPQLGYFLAEGWLRLGDPQAAEKAADAASEAILEQLKAARNLRSLNFDEIQANRHFQLARVLAGRGLFDWAEREYVRALTLDLPEDTETIIRADLAQFYWFGSKNQEAAQTLEPLAAKILSSDVDLPPAPGDFSSPAATLANYYFYNGLAAIERGQHSSAFEQLTQALQIESAPANPDIVIAMRSMAEEEPYQSQFRKHFEQMSGDFRVHVANAEEELSLASDRMRRASAVPILASECNQLAWLLAKCEESPREALNLSLRSLELMPDEPAFLDTLARCYYANGLLKQAIHVQKRAVKLAPFERQMNAQLQEFERALAQQSANSVETN